MNPFSLLRVPLRQLYLLQLEQYDIRRYLSLVCKAPHRIAVAPRQSLHWTPKAKAVFGMALFLQLVFSFAAARVVYLVAHAYGLAAIAFILVLAASLLCSFLFLSLGVLVLLPLDIFLKRRSFAKGKQALSRTENLTIIGITGSYGKTTMKEMLSTLLAEHFRVLKTPENINTPLGISRLVVEKLRPNTEIFIAEMGAYRQGDIRALCQIVQPSVSVLTGINESHLERFGSIERTIVTKFEVVEEARPDAFVVLNADDERVVASYAVYFGGREAIFYSANNNPLSAMRISRQHFFEDGSGISFDLSTKEGERLGSFKVPFLGAYAVGTLLGAIMIARRLGMSMEEIRRGVTLLRPVAHRLQPLPVAGGILVIDDSYNGNPAGVAEAIRVLGRFSGRRKLYLTPGLVEMGETSPAVHRAIGEQLSGVADMVLLIRNSVTPYIAEGLTSRGYPAERLRWFATAEEVHTALPKILESGDVIVFQNDWPDNYV